jgi:hypothetical protein
MGRPRTAVARLLMAGALASWSLASSSPAPAQEASSSLPSPSIGDRRVVDVGRALSRRRAAAVGEPLSLRTGFVPDPVVVRGSVQSGRALADLGEGCAGVSSLAPTQRVRMETRFGFLRIFATGPDDLTLAVRTEDGAVLCSDDRFGRHPSVEGRFAPGTLDVWVGVQPAPVGASIDGRFELELTETRSIRPGVRSGEEDERLSLAIEAGLEVRAERGRDGDLRLRRGFLPDPRHLQGTTVASEDLVDVGGLGDTCRGFVPATPSHVLTLLDDLDFFQIYVAQAPESATVVVLGPDGSVSCDSADGEHPHITRGAWPTGPYRIWVGAHRTDAAFPYQLGLSEIRRAR